MATLTRPGVDITQVITPAAPTVLNPSLVPCIVGPCFEIVQPLADGKINGSAKVLTAAVLVADNSTAGTVDLSGATLNITVNSQVKTIQFPAVVAGAQFTKTQILNVVNEQLVGLVVASYDSNNQLNIKTLAKGPVNANLAVTYVQGGTAEKLGFSANQSVTGNEAYTGLTYAARFSDLPVSKAKAVSELVFDNDALDLYRDFNNVISKTSKTSATQWTSLIPDINAGSADVSITTSSWRRHPLAAKNKPGPRTNVVVHNGTQARIRIPLNHAVGSGAVKWPDVTGQNYLEMVCVGVSPTGAGLYIGDAGNDVSVTFVNNDAAVPLCAGSWNAGTKTLTITYKNACTFNDLKSAIQAANGTNTPITNYVAQAFVASVVFNDQLGGTTLVGLGGKTFKLWGGQDPVNFQEDAATANAGAGERAVLRGSVEVGGGAGSTAAALGIAGEKLFVSVDGDPYVEIVLTGNVAIATAIDAHPKVVATTQSVTLPDNTSVNVLELASDGNANTNTGADSTITVKADNPKVLEQLFGGFVSRVSEAIPANPATLLSNDAWDNANNGIVARKVALAPGALGNYNTHAVAAGEKAIVPGSLRVTLQDLTSAGALIFSAAATLAGAQGDDKKLKIVHTDATDTLDLNDPAVANPTKAALVTKILNKIAAGNLAGKVACALVDGKVVISEATGTAGKQVKLADVGDDTTQNVKTWLGSAATHWGVFTTTTVTGDVVVQDIGSSNTWQVTAANADFTSSWKVAADISLSSSFLTQLLIDQTASPKPGFNYSQGKTDLVNTVAGGLVFRGQDQPTVAVAVPAIVPLIARLNNDTSAVIDYSRVAANAVHGIPVQYQGKVFHARPNQVKVGDTLYNKGAVKGKVVGFESHTYNGTLYANNALVLSDFTVDNNTFIQDWYVVAENLQTESPQRLLPELVVSELDQSLSLKHTLNRNLAGIPVLDANAFVYVGYKALRKDVSADTANPEMLVFSSVTDVESSIGPIDPENPLAFAMYVAFLHSVNVTINGLGVGATSADSPEGTVLAYKEALDFLTLKEVYALAPLTQDPGVHDLFALHCSVMSEPEGRKERIALVNRALPTEKVPTLVASGTATIGAGYGPTNDLFDLTFTDPSLNLLTALNGKVTANGSVIDLSASGGALTPTDGVFLDREGDPYSYLIVNVPNASVLTIQVANVYGPGYGPGTGGNGDAYFRTAAPADFEVDGEFCAVYVRQAALSLNTTAGKLGVCETLAEIAGGATGYQNRRLFIEMPEKVGLPFNGTELLVPGYYLCVADIARIAQLSPSQPFTNLPYNGFTRVVGSSDKFSENQMATAAAGGIWWVIQDTPGGALACRHQLSTDVSTLKTRELSITKSVDYLAKLIREQVKRYIGRNNITPQLLELLSLTLTSALQSAVGSVVQEASLDKVEQDATNPDTVTVEISVIPFYPCNRIKITIKV